MTPVIVIPVHNEVETIARVVAGARRHAPVIVVDDGSSDESAAVASGAGAEVIRHAGRRGKGAALRSGIAAARARGASAVLTLDGDGQHAPEDVPLLLRALGETPDRLVIGDRLTHTAGFARARLNAMEVAAFFVEWVSALGVRDTQSGFRAYPMPLLDDVRTTRGGFVFETEVLVAAARRGWRAREVIVRSIPSARRRSRFRPLRDGLAIGAFLTGQALGHWGRVFRARVSHRARSGPWGPAPMALAVAPPPSGEDGARVRRGRAAAVASTAAPILLVAAALQAVLGRLGVDLVTPLVGRFYARERLTGSASPAAALGPESLARLDAPLATSPGAQR
jgi:hypothetical protein